MSLLDWLSDGLGLGGGPNGGTPMSPGPGSMMGGMDPMGSPTGQMEPMPTAAPAPTMPMLPVQPDNMDPANRGMTPDMPPPMAFNATRDPIQNRNPMTEPMPGVQGAGSGVPPVPLPVPRPDGAPGLPGAPTDISSAGPAGAPMSLAPPGAMEQFAPSMSPGDKGGGTAKGILESALGLSPERATRVRGQLGAGLKSVAENSSKPGLAAFAGSMGSGIEGGTKSDEKQTDQRTKLLNQMITAQAAGDKAAYTKSLTAYTQAKLEAEKTKAANPEAAAKSRAAMTEEQKLFKINDALAKDPQVKAAQHLLESTKRQGTPKEVAAAQKSFDDLFKTKKTEITEALRPGSATNPHKVTSQDDLKGMKPGDVYINPSDGKPYVFKGAKKEGASAAPAAAPAAETGAMTPAAQSGLPSPKAAANPTDDDE